MSLGFIGYVMKNNVKVNEFPFTVSTLPDGSQRATYDAYDFVGIKGLARRDAKRLFLTKKRYPITKIFRYSSDWDTLTDKGCISYWDQTSQAQIPAFALKNIELYEQVTENQKRASDVLYYCLDADKLVEKLMTPLQQLSLKDFILPSLLIGGIILTAVMNVYAASQYLQAWGVIKGTIGTLGALQKYFQQIGGLPINMILPPGLFGLLLRKKDQNKKLITGKPKNPEPYDYLKVLIKEKELVTSQITVPLYREFLTDENGTTLIRNSIILKDGKKAYRLYIKIDENYALKGIKNSTIFILYKHNDPQEPFKQLSLAEMGMDPEKSKPLNEDMGKVLAKIYQDNLDAQKKSTTMIAGLTKGLFYVFIFSIVTYIAMYSVNILFTAMAINALHSATAAVNFLTSHSLYRIAPIGNTINTSTIATNAIK